MLVRKTGSIILIASMSANVFYCLLIFITLIGYINALPDR